jgi:inosose dehydratase
MSGLRLRLATGPVSWGVDFADDPANPPWERVLDEIARSGFRATELGPVGYLPEDPIALRSAISGRGLAVGGSFLFQPLYDPHRRAEVLAVARRTCAAIAAAGGEHLVVLDLVSPDRAATAGRTEDARRLDADGWERLLQAVRAVAAIAAEHGLRPVFHPHAGSYVEFADEVERLLADDPIDLCLDTGHSAIAGIDPVALLRRHAGRIPYLHLKDVDPVALDRVRRAGLDFWSAIRAGVFVPLGHGMVDLPAIAATLESSGFDGWATVEQDRVPGSGTPLHDVIASRRHLERIGLGDTAGPAPVTAAPPRAEPRAPAGGPPSAGGPPAGDR